MITDVASRAAPVLLAILMLLAIGCGERLERRPIPSPAPAEPTPAPRPISLPADEHSHDDRLEWWYYSGHLTAISGQEFGFHFVIFQSLDDTGEPAYAAQFSLTDVSGDTHLFDTRLFAGIAETTSSELFGLRVRDWSLDIGRQSHRISAVMDDGTAIELELQTGDPSAVVLHNQIGWFDSPTGWSYYYSRPSMAAKGSVTLGGSRFEVEGSGWFDHQWGDFFAVGAPGGWQWMGLQLGNGDTLMVIETRRPDGATNAVFGTWADGTGRSRALTERDGISIEVLDTWTSPSTGGEYPSRWRVLVDGLDLDVTVTPVVADQEITEGVPVPAIYWEGKVTVDGVYRGSPLVQVGYVELTGYVEVEPVPWRK